MKQLPEFFRIGFRETHVGTLVNVEAFCEPHDDDLVASIRPLATHARMDEDFQRAELQVRLSDMHIAVLGGFTSSRTDRWMETTAIMAAQALKMRFTEAEKLKEGIADLIVNGLVPKSAAINLPLRVVLKEGAEDARVILEEGQKPVVMHANIRVEDHDVVVDVPTLPKGASFHKLGTELREETVRETVAEVLNKHGLFTRA